MNATELFHKDGRPAGVWYCELCRLTFSRQDAAELCCKPYVCSLRGKPCKQFHTICESCQSARRIAIEQETFEKAVKLTEWDGWVYREGFGFQDGFFSSIDELAVFCLEDGVDLPSYAWTCTSKRLVELNIDDILQGVLDDIQDPSSPDRMGFDGIADIRKAIEVFNKANKHLLTYDPDFTACVLLKRNTNHSHED